MASVTVPLDGLPKLGMPLCSMIRSVELVLTKAEDLRRTADLHILKVLPAFDALFVNGRKVHWGQVASFDKLRVLHIWNCDQTLELRDALFVNLKDLEIRKCSEFNDLWHIQRFMRLERLSVQDVYSNSHSLHVLSTLTNLQYLELIDCRWVNNLDWIGPLTTLSSLSLSGCENLRSVKPLRNMTQLQNLNLDGCTMLTYHERTPRYLSSLWRLQDFSANEWFGDGGLHTHVDEMPSPQTRHARPLSLRSRSQKSFWRMVQKT